VTARYATPSALRAALDTRLPKEAQQLGRDPNWLRRRLAFARLLVRLVDLNREVWVLKGGMAVELRRPGLARATRDVDLVLRPGLVDNPADPTAIREILIEAMLSDRDHDGFDFRVGNATRLRDDAYARPAWRYAVAAALAGRPFANLRLDIVARPEEISGVERRQVPDVLGFAGIPTRDIWVTDLRQQFAEKLHALTRTYQTGESTRVRDLVDLVLLIEDGVPADPPLVAAVQRVFAVRGTHAVPTTLDTPPDGWREPFAALAAEISLGTASHTDAHDLVAEHWLRAHRSTPQET
jgi:hypothetical protein